MNTRVYIYIYRLCSRGIKNSVGEKSHAFFYFIHHTCTGRCHRPVSGFIIGLLESSKKKNCWFFCMFGKIP